MQQLIKILISYSQANTMYVKWLKSKLEKYFDENPFEIWVDQSGLPFGSVIKKRLESEIYNSDYVIVIISRASLQSKWVQFEIQTALNFEKKTNNLGKNAKQIFLIPLLIEQVELPKNLSDRLFIDCTRSWLQENNINRLAVELANTTLSFWSMRTYVVKRKFDDVAKKITESNSLVIIRSPMIGTFYRKASPDKPLFVDIGSHVSPGTVACIIEAMKLFNEIESEVYGTIVKILVEDSSPVEYDQPLFLVEPGRK